MPRSKGETSGTGVGLLRAPGCETAVYAQFSGTLKPPAVTNHLISPFSFESLCMYPRDGTYQVEGYVGIFLGLHVHAWAAAIHSDEGRGRVIRESMEWRMIMSQSRRTTRYNVDVYEVERSVESRIICAKDDDRTGRHDSPPTGPTRKPSTWSTYPQTSQTPLHHPPQVSSSGLPPSPALFP